MQTAEVIDPHSTGRVKYFATYTLDDDHIFEYDCDQSAFDKIVSLLLVESIISNQMDSGFFYYGPVTWVAHSYPYSHSYCPLKHLALLVRGKRGGIL